MNKKSFLSKNIYNKLKNKFLNLQSSDLRKRIASGYSWSLIAAVVLQIFNLITSVIVARILGNETFGEYGILLNTIGMLGIFAGLGLGITATKHIAELRVKEKHAIPPFLKVLMFLGLFSSILIILVVLLFSNQLSTKVLNNKSLIYALQISSFTIIPNTVVGIQVGVLSGFEKFKQVTYSNFLRGIFSIPTTILLTFFFQLNGAISAFLLISCMQYFTNNILIKRLYLEEKLDRTVKISLVDFKNYIPILKDFSLPALLLNIVVIPPGWILNVMVVNQPNGYLYMAILNAAQQWRNALFFIPNNIGQALISVLSSIKKNNITQQKRIINFNILIFLLIALPILFVVVFFSKDIVGFYKLSYGKSELVLIILMISAVIQIITMPIGHFLTANDHMWVGFLLNLGWSIVLMISAVILFPKVDPSLAVSIAFLISYLFQFITAYSFYHHRIRHG